MNDICVLVCQNNEREIQSILSSAEFEGVSYATYPSQKGNPPLQWRDFGNVIAGVEDCRHFCLFGGCCVPEPGSVPSEFGGLLVNKVEYCVKVLVDGAFLDYLTGRGAYVISPGWLEGWQRNVEEMGLTADSVSAFNDSVKEFVLLDTGVAPDVGEKMQACAAFFSLPYQIVPVGLDYFRMRIASLVNEKKLEIREKCFAQESARARREISEYAMTLEVAKELAATFSEEEIIQKALELFVSIFSPGQAFYLPVDDGVNGKLTAFPVGGGGGGTPGPNVIERIQATNADYAWNESDSSFVFKIVHNMNLLGYIEISHIAYPEYKDHYLAIARCVMDVCALALNNARSYEQLQQKTLELQASEAKVNLILENAGEGIYGLDRAGHTTFANKAAIEMLGFPLEEMIGVSQHDLIHHSLPDGTPYKREDCNIYAAMEDGVVHTETEEVFWHKNGGPVPIEYTSAPIIERDGEICGAVVVFKDITERKEAEDALRAANLELEEFAYRTSHDLRSPLVSSSRLLEMATELINSGDAEGAIECMEIAGRSLLKLDVLVQDILALTKTKNVDEEDDAIAVGDVVDSSLEKFSHMENYCRVSFIKDYVDLPVVYTKRSRFTLIVENLISNAIKYQDVDKDDSFIRVACRFTDHDFVFCVEDNGLGVPVEHQDKMFNMFQRFHSGVSFGSGLGLYMMKKSADIIGGELSYTDTGSGSIFQLTIPKELVLRESEKK